jgi:hypothetical protein
LPRASDALHVSVNKLRCRGPGAATTALGHQVQQECVVVQIEVSYLGCRLAPCPRDPAHPTRGFLTLRPGNLPKSRSADHSSEMP